MVYDYKYNRIGIGFCLYMITKVSQYEINWNLLSTVFLKTIKKSNTFLQVTRTYILIISITIIVLTFLYPENDKLKIMISFFGISNTLIMLTSSALRETGSNLYNMKIFLVNKILSLDEKQIIFKNVFQRVLNEKYNMTGDNITKYQGLINDEHFSIYNQRLTELKDPLSIYNYAVEILQNHIINANQQGFLTGNYVYLKYAVIIIGISLIILAGITILRKIAESDNIEKGAEIHKAIVELSTEATQQTGALLKTMANAVEAINGGFVELLKTSDIPATLVNDSVKDAMTKLQDILTEGYLYITENFKKIHEMLNLNTDTIILHTDQITELENRIQQLEEINNSR